MIYLNTGQKLFITKSESMGGLLTLSDRSQWKVSSFDKTTSMLWMAIDDVIVSDGFLGKYKITHIKRKETVEAELIQK
jgi:hypothetical protein